MPKPSNSSFRPGKRLGGFYVVDAKARVRTLPADPEAVAKFLRGIERKKKSKLSKKVLIPKVVSRHILLKVLKGLDFKQRGESSHWHHPSYGTIILLAGSTNIDVRKHPPIRKAITAWLAQGNKL